MREQDVMHRFLIESADVRGVMVRLDDAWQEALLRTDYPEEVQQYLGEAMAATVLLTASIKFSGKLTLQVRGDGPLNLLVVQATPSGTVRGMANWSDTPPSAPLKAALGEAQMSISITGTESGADYQGVVEIVGDSLGEALRGYFKHSEQLETDLRLTVNKRTAAGFLIQKLPGEASDPDGWSRSRQLASTLVDEELTGLPIADVLHRLYHEEQVRLFDEQPLAFECSCSRDRVAAMIRGLGQDEAESIVREQGQIEVTCEFCNARYSFDPVDVASLFKSPAPDRAEHASTRH